MKKQIAVIFAAAAVALVATPSWAFRSVSITTVTAQTTTGGARVADFTLAIRNVNDPLGASQAAVNWSGVDPLSTGWKLADQLLVINSTVTDVAGGIKIYTDNTAADATPRFVAPTNVSTAPTSVAAGLLNAGAATTSAPALPMAWSVKTSPVTPTSANPSNTSDTNSFQWLIVTDKSNWASGTDFNGDQDTTDVGDATPQALDAPFVTIINNVGVHFGQANTEFASHPDGANSFVYLEANFAGAEVQQVYRTSTLRVEAFVQ